MKKAERALNNRIFVINKVLEKQPAVARILAELVHTPLHFQSEHFSRVVGFGDCETDKPPRFGKGDIES